MICRCVRFMYVAFEDTINTYFQIYRINALIYRKFVWWLGIWTLENFKKLWLVETKWEGTDLGFEWGGHSSSLSTYFLTLLQSLSFSVTIQISCHSYSHYWHILSLNILSLFQSLLAYSVIKYSVILYPVTFPVTGIFCQ